PTQGRGDPGASPADPRAPTRLPPRCPPAASGHRPPPALQGPGGAGPGPPGRLRVRGPGLPLPLRRGQGHHRLALQRLPLLPPHRQGGCRMKNRNGKSSAPPTLPLVRCAVYTRKSTEEGLEQEFNTLDAQRESAEAFIASQQHEGWQCLPTRYDDGGFT